MASWIPALVGIICLMMWLDWNNLHYWPLLWVGVMGIVVSVALDKPKL